MPILGRWDDDAQVLRPAQGGGRVWRYDESEDSSGNVEAALSSGPPGFYLSPALHF